MKPNDAITDLQSSFELQRAAFAQHRHSEWPERRDRLQRLRRLLSQNEGAIEGAISSDFGLRPPIETQIAELFPSFAEINGALRAGRRC